MTNIDWGKLKPTRLPDADRCASCGENYYIGCACDEHDEPERCPHGFYFDEECWDCDIDDDEDA